MSKKYTLLAFLLAITVLLYGQRDGPYNISGFDEEFFHIGYYVGLNVMGFTVDANEGFQIDTRERPGINVGLATCYRLGKYLEMKFLPGMSFGQRDLKIRDTSQIFYGDPTWETRIESVFIEFPLLLKYRANRENNYAPYILCGIAPRVDIFGGEIVNAKKVSRLIKIFDYYPELGVGIDFYLYKVKMSTELRFSVGQMNVYLPMLEEDAYKLFDNSINSLRSKMVSLTIQFLGR